MEDEPRTEANTGANASTSIPEPACSDQGTTSTCDHQVLNAIIALKQELFQKIDEKATETQAELRNVVGKINTRLDSIESRTTDLESGVSAHSDIITGLESDVLKMKEDLATLKAKYEDLEARSRRSNLRVTGVKEGRENGKPPSEYIAAMLKQSLGLDKLPCLDRAHRTIRTRPTTDDAPPRAFVIKCHYFTEKEMLLKKATEAGVIKTADGDRIRVLPDFTQAVSKQRAAFTEVRGLLRGCEGVRYGLRYPAILRITTPDGREHRFNDPKKAKDFVLKECKTA